MTRVDDMNIVKTNTYKGKCEFFIYDRHDRSKELFHETQAYCQISINQTFEKQLGPRKRTIFVEHG